MITIKKRFNPKKGLIWVILLFGLLSVGVIIANTAPSILTIILDVTSTNNYTTGNFTAVVTASDNDSDSINYIYDWRVDGTSIALLNLPFSTNGSNNWTTVKDYSSYNQNVVYNGSSNTMPRWNRTGGYDGLGAYEFDGINDYLSENVTTGANMTLAFRFKANKLNIINISMGTSHTCVLIDNGDVYCWGENRYGQLGDGTNENMSLIPSKALMSYATQISAGGNITCAANASGMYCWGRNDQGELGDGTTVDKITPTKTLMTAPTIMAAGSTTCAANASGMYCWGYNAFGEIGNGSVGSYPVDHNEFPTKNLMTNPIKIIRVHSTTCATNASGMYCWGRNDQGEIGDGTTGQRTTPTKSLMTNVTTMVGMYGTICATNDSGMYCWGGNNYGQIGDGTTTNRLVPTKTLMTAPITITAGYVSTYASAGRVYICATNNSGMYCWGFGSDGELGNGSAAATNEFPTKNYMTNATMIAAGAMHTCAVNKSGAYCWGENKFGAIGDFSVTNTTSPKPVIWEVLTMTRKAISLTPNYLENVLNFTKTKARSILDVTDSQWHSITIAKGAGNITVYQDGTAVYTTVNSEVSSILLSAIGRNNPDEYFNGSIDQFLIYNRTLGLDQVVAMYYNGLGNYSLVVKDETKKHEVWQVAVTPNDGSVDGTTAYSTNFTLNHQPNKPLLLTNNNTNTTDTTPTLLWANAGDNNTDTLTYILQVSQTANFSIINYTNVSIAETNNTTNDTTTVLADGIYFWRVRANDGLENSSWSETYRIIVDDDIEVPRIEYESPANATTLTSSLTVQFYWNITEANLANCSLYINGALQATNTSQSARESYSVTLSNGNYNWSIRCTDLSNNQNSSTGVRFFTLNYIPKEETTTDPGGEGGGGISVTTPSTKVDIDLVNGPEKVLDLKQGSIKTFSLDNPSTSTHAVTHTITINQVLEDKVNITIASDPVTVIIVVGETRKLDLNKDSIMDVAIKLLEIQNGIAKLEFKKLEQPQITSVKTANETTSKFTGEQNITTQKDELQQQETIKTRLSKYSKAIKIIGVVLIIAAIVSIIVISRKKINKIFRYIRKQL